MKISVRFLITRICLLQCSLVFFLNEVIWTLLLELQNKLGKGVLTHIHVSCLSRIKQLIASIMKLLLSKWENYSVGGKYVTWFKSLSEERRQCVQVNDVIPDFLYLSAVVQQGYILWLQLFLIFITDLAGACEFPNSISCADDTVFFINYRKNQDELHSLNKFSEMFPKWLSVKKLVLNIDETQAITVLKSYDEMIDFSASNFD